MYLGFNFLCHLISFSSNTNITFRNVSVIIHSFLSFTLSNIIDNNLFIFLPFFHHLDLIPLYLVLFAICTSPIIHHVCSPQSFAQPLFLISPVGLSQCCGQFQAITLSLYSFSQKSRRLKLQVAVLFSRLPALNQNPTSCH